MEGRERLDDKVHFLPAIIEKFEDKMAVFITKDGQKLLWPIKNLPDDCQVGSEVRLILSTAKTQSEERAKLAKSILNQILKDKS